MIKTSKFLIKILFLDVTILILVNGNELVIDNIMEKSSQNNYEFLKKTAPNLYKFKFISFHILFVLGICFNFLSFFVWYKMKRTSSSIYIMFLSINDLLVMAVTTTSPYYEVYKFCKYITLLAGYFQYTSNFYMLGFTFERWLIISRPFIGERISTIRKALFTCISIAVILFLLNLVNLITADNKENCSSGTAITSAIFEAICSFIVPLMALILNCLVIRIMVKVRKNNQLLMGTCGNSNSENKNISSRIEYAGSGNNFRSSTMTLLSTSFFIIVMSLMAGIWYVLQYFFEQKKTDGILETDSLANYNYRRTKMWVISYTISNLIAIQRYYMCFVIYLKTAQSFRKKFTELFWNRISNRTTNTAVSSFA